MKNIHVNDAGGSLVVHAFGAYFGIAVAFGMRVKASKLPAAHRNTTYFRLHVQTNLSYVEYMKTILSSYLSNFNQIVQFNPTTYSFSNLLFLRFVQLSHFQWHGCNDRNHSLVDVLAQFQWWAEVGIYRIQATFSVSSLLISSFFIFSTISYPSSSVWTINYLRSYFLQRRDTTRTNCSQHLSCDQCELCYSLCNFLSLS